MVLNKLLLAVPVSGNGGWRAYCSPLTVLALGAFFAGCVGDTTLLQENAAIALRSARFEARSDLQCPAADVTVQSEQEVPGAPWGYLYSDYRIRAEGCGRTGLYDVECRDERLCKVTRKTP